MKEFKLSSENSDEVFSKVKGCIKQGKGYRISLTELKKRSLDANAQMHVWCKLISQDTGEDIKTVTLRNKRDFGLPILLSKDSERAVTVGWMLSRCGFHNMSDSQQLRMIEAFEVTRTFTSSEHNQLRDNMQNYWGEQGMILPYIS